ncbi:nitrilase-related carbon-nitrogen hydrolase [Methanococcoides methylutens]|uniref:nitrilase-related carbon-nitrogen hydrolase n=1 Tax=Methanococcoides methylutens TaxID=2226 RepID=UPI0040445925
MKPIKAAAIQMDISHCKKQDNIRKALMLSENAISQGADLIVLPEVFSTGFCYEDLDNAGEAEPFPTIEQLRDFSRQNSCVMIGSIIQKHKKKEEEDHFTNLGFCIENGDLAGTYVKTHPFGKEKGYFIPGDSIEPIHLKSYDLTIGLEICYEMRFPEISRKLAIAGSDILVTIAEFPNPREYQWRSLATTRSVENQIYHIACNRTGADPDSTFFGATMILDPLGNILADAKDKECFIIHEIDPEIMKDTRKAIPVFDDRRPELY